MKKVILFVVFTTLVFCSYSQGTKKILSKADDFSSKAGTLIERKSYDIGKVKTVKVEVQKLTNLMDKTSVSSLRFEYTTGGSYSSTKIGVLDSDEIDGLIKSIKILQTSVFNTKPDTYTEIVFTSRTGFEAGCYYSERKSAWSTYLKLEKYDGKSTVFMNIADFETLLKIAEKAQVKIKSL